MSDEDIVVSIRPVERAARKALIAQRRRERQSRNHVIRPRTGRLMVDVRVIVPTARRASQGGGGTYSHGESYTITGSGFGTKSDNNNEGHSFQGSQHLARVATDLDDATSALSTTDTENGWKNFTGGIYPIFTGTDFMNNAGCATHGNEVIQSGGPGQSGRYLYRDVTTSRLRNWNLLDESIAPDYLYISFHITLDSAYQGGKWWRQYFTNTVNSSNNFFFAGASSITGDDESSDDTTVFSSSPSGLPSGIGNFARVELHQDFVNDRLRIYLDGQLVTSSKFSPTSDFSWLQSSGGGSRTIDYAILANTPSIGDELGYALIYADDSSKRVELADSATWASRTQSIWQAPVSWSDSSIEIRINKGDLPSGTHYLHVMDGETSIYSEQVEIA